MELLLLFLQALPVRRRLRGESVTSKEFQGVPRCGQLRFRLTTVNPSPQASQCSLPELAIGGIRRDLWFLLAGKPAAVICDLRRPVKTSKCELRRRFALVALDSSMSPCLWRNGHAGFTVFKYILSSTQVYTVRNTFTAWGHKVHGAGTLLRPEGVDNGNPIDRGPRPRDRVGSSLDRSSAGVSHVVRTHYYQANAVTPCRLVRKITMIST